MTIDEIAKLIEEHHFDIAYDNDGQIIIYTGVIDESHQGEAEVDEHGQPQGVPDPLST
jgi:hypothetical protein